MFKAAANTGTLYYDINADSIDSSTDPGTITVTVPNNAVPPLTAVTDFVPSFEITGSEFTVGGSPKKSGADTVTFNPTATVDVNGTATKQYEITVNVLQNSAKEISSFMFRAIENSGISADYTGTISGTDITVNIPTGDITNLVPYIVTSPESTWSDNPNDYTVTNPAPYTVTAEDGSTQVYNVYVTTGVPSSEKEITAFEFNSIENSSLPVTYTSDPITGPTINIKVSENAALASLIPRITVSSGATVTPATLTANNFTTSPVSYTVKAADGSEQIYSVNVDNSLSSAKEITAFDFRTGVNTGLVTDYFGSLGAGNVITFNLPATEDISLLMPDITASAGVTITPAGFIDFTGSDTTPVPFTVTAEDGSTQVYNVYVIPVVSSSEKEITAFNFNSIDNPSLPVDYSAVITGTDINIEISDNAAVASLLPEITVSPLATVTPSSLTANNFSTSPVSYTVEAQDTSTQVYNVYVSLLSSAKEITAFSFENNTDNPSLAATYTGTITGTDITLDISDTEDITTLTPTITASPDASVITTGPQNFTGSDTTPVEYTVRAADGSEQIYSVYVHVQSSAKEIISFDINKIDNPSLVVSGAVGSITGTNIYIMLSDADNLTSLIPEISVSPGATVSPLSLSANDFSSSPVTYTVTAEDGSTQVYSVTVYLMSNAKEITAFDFNTGDNPSLAASYTGTISGTDITFDISDTEDITSLTPAINASALSSVSPSGAVDFAGSDTTPVEYTVTAQDGTQQIYSVYVNVLSSAKEITAFGFKTGVNTGLGADYSGSIGAGNVITVNLPVTEDIISLMPDITASAGVSITPAGFVDFTGSDTTPVEYTVTAQDGSSQVYSVSVNYTGWDYFDDIATQMSYNGTGEGLEMDINRYSDSIICAFQDSENSGGVSTFLWQGGPWKSLDPRNFTGGAATDISLAVRNTAEDYFIANQMSTDGKLRISESIGNAVWSTVSESSADATLPPSDIEATSSSLFLIYRDVLNSDQVTVHEWDGSSLQDRSTGLMKSNATNRQNFKLTSDNTETLYATYYDDSGSFVMQEYTGSSWDDAGSSDFSSVEPYTYFDVAAHQSLARIYCASVATNGVVYIRSKSGLSWNIFAIAANDADISTGAGNFIKLEVDSAGNVYLFYRDILGHPKLVKFDSSGNKITVDGVVDDYINHHIASYGNIAVDSSDKVYLAFQDDSDGQKIVIMTYTP